MIWHKSFGGAGLKRSLFFIEFDPNAFVSVSCGTLSSVPSSRFHRDLVARPRERRSAIRRGPDRQLSFLPEPEVAQAVEDVAQNTIIRGTKEYNKDEYIAGAVAAYLDARVSALDRKAAKYSTKCGNRRLIPEISKSERRRSGTLAVRYVVQPQGDQKHGSAN